MGEKGYICNEIHFQLFIMVYKMKKTMKTIILMVAALAMVAATSCAQNNKEVAQESMTEKEIMEKLQPLIEKVEAIPEDENEDEAKKQAILEFVEENQNDAGVYLIQHFLAFSMPIEELIKYVDEREYFRNHPKIIEAKKVWEVRMKTGEGKMFQDFEAEYEGKVTKLSDYVGKGKYVLVDFWASWCGPCREEIPTLIKVYEKYKGDKFEVLGVATWDNPKDTKKAIEQLSIPYPQMLNAQKAGSDVYGINGIPQIMLFAPDGTLIKKDLRGEEIVKAVEEALNGQ